MYFLCVLIFNSNILLIVCVFTLDAKCTTCLQKLLLGSCNVNYYWYLENTWERCALYQKLAADILFYRTIETAIYKIARSERMQFKIELFIELFCIYNILKLYMWKYFGFKARESTFILACVVTVEPQSSQTQATCVLHVCVQRKTSQREFQNRVSCTSARVVKGAFSFTKMRMLIFMAHLYLQYTIKHLITCECDNQ